MGIDLYKYASEIVDFVNEDTLKAIDYGILDLSHIKNVELRRVFCYIERKLEDELRKNYTCNNTGIFRVSHLNGIWYYRQEKLIINSDSLGELKKSVISQKRIWYVFDEYLAINYL